MANAKNILAALPIAAAALLSNGAQGQVQAAGRNYTAESYRGTLLDGPFAGQQAGAGMVPGDGSRRIRLQDGTVVVCGGGNDQVNRENGHAPTGSANRHCAPAPR